MWVSYRRVIITGDTPLALIMWGLIILWKKKCCLWVATDLNSSISSKALSGSLSSCSCNSAFVGFLILNRIGPLRHICAGMFLLIFTWTQAVRILMQVTVLTDLFNPHLLQIAGTHRKTFENVFGPAFCFPCCILLKSYSCLRIVVILFMWSKMRIVLSIISVWLMIKAGVKHLMTTGNRTWPSWEGSAVSVHLFCSDLFYVVTESSKTLALWVVLIFCLTIKGASLQVPTNVLLKPRINTFLYSCSTQCLSVHFSPRVSKNYFYVTSIQGSQLLSFCWCTNVKAISK